MSHRIPFMLHADGKKHDDQLVDADAIRRRLMASGRSGDVFTLRTGDRISDDAGGIELVAAADGEKKEPRRFRMDAYNGGAMRFWWSEDPVVVDLDGMKISAKARPIFKDHSPSLIVGHSEKIINATGKLRVEGIASGANQVARDVVNAADMGFPWQSSIGAEVERVEQVRAGVEVAVNGQTFAGPLLIVRASRLSEVSFVALGADDSTAARMAASRNQPSTSSKETLMKTRIHLAALLALAAAFPHLTAALNERAEVTDKEDDEAKKGAADLKAWAESQPKAKTPAAPADDEAAALQASRDKRAAELDRQAAIEEVCAGKHPKIQAQAIREGWSRDKTELEVVRAERPQGPSIHGGHKPAGSDVLEVAVMQAARADEKRLIATYGEKLVEAAHRAFRGRISLNQVIIEAARTNGFSGNVMRVDAEVLRAAFSTNDIGGILSNVANKTILDAFMAVDQAWRSVSAIRPVSDFKAITSYRLTGDLTYEKVGNGGEIKHGTLGEESFTNKADTYAKMLGITRQDLRNDDLGALTQVARMLGRGAALKLNEVFWAAFLADNTTFWTTARGNYFEGASSVLSIDSLSTAEQMFLDQKDANSKPLGISPRILLVPTALSAKAAALMASTELRDTTASTKYPVANPHAGKFRTVTSPYLSTAAMGGGYSSTAWHMLADPMDLAVIETVFLDGQEAPTVESADADFNTLGIQMRGFHDFGVAKQDYRGGVRSKGAA